MSVLLETFGPLSGAMWITLGPIFGIAFVGLTLTLIDMLTKKEWARRWSSNCIIVEVIVLFLWPLVVMVVGIVYIILIQRS